MSLRKSKANATKSAPDNESKKQVSENTPDDHKSTTGGGGNKKTEIEITRYKAIVNAFNSPTALAKLIIVISLIIILVFLGISIIALVLKSYYPYRTVNSNEYGATIINNEDNEVIYWLFNTADLWANSGIRVKKGDVISIRASGAFHTAIHHLVKDADSNRQGDKWISPMGGMGSSNPRDDYRAGFRLSRTHPFNTLLMQVVPDETDLKNEDGEWKIEFSYYLDGRPKWNQNNNHATFEDNKTHPDIYAIGAERDKVTIRNDGILHFTVNDIVLTKDNIMKMKERVEMDNKKGVASALQIGDFPIPDKKDTSGLKKDIDVLIKGLDNLRDKNSNDIAFKFCNDVKENNRYNDESQFPFKRSYQDLYRKLDSLYKIIEECGSKEYTLSLNDSSIFRGKDVSELDYYLICNFVDAWYVDNAGSYLIVIERKKQ